MSLLNFPLSCAGWLDLFVLHAFPATFLFSRKLWYEHFSFQVSILGWRRGFANSWMRKELLNLWLISSSWLATILLSQSGPLPRMLEILIMYVVNENICYSENMRKMGNFFIPSYQRLGKRPWTTLNWLRGIHPTEFAIRIRCWTYNHL